MLPIAMLCNRDTLDLLPKSFTPVKYVSLS